MKTAVIIAAAGASRRMGLDKLLISINGKSVIRRSAEAFVPFADTLAVVCSADNESEIRHELEGLQCIFCRGGSTRAQSVKAALDCISDADIVLIHDGARPLVSSQVIKDCIAVTKEKGCAIAAVPAKDTIRRCINGKASSAPPRNELWQMQTPQGFDFKRLAAAYQTLSPDATDDASVYENAGYPVFISQGDYRNIKLTTAEDICAARAFAKKEQTMRTGNGFDVHAFAQNRRLVLCGTEIPYHLGLAGHSDADVALHALADALLGAAGMRDIGYYFPDSDAKYKDADSMLLLRQVAQMLRGRGLLASCADITIIAQAPKLSPYIEQMRGNVAAALGIGPDRVGVKATTTEGLGFTGRKEGIAALATVLLEESL